MKISIYSSNWPSYNHLRQFVQVNKWINELVFCKTGDPLQKGIMSSEMGSLLGGMWRVLIKEPWTSCEPSNDKSTQRELEQANLEEIQQTMYWGRSCETLLKAICKRKESGRSLTRAQERVNNDVKAALRIESKCANKRAKLVQYPVTTQRRIPKFGQCYSTALNLER